MAVPSQDKLRKMLEMLIMLGGKYGRTKKALSKHFEISERTVSRYIETFENIGFVVDKNDNRYKINILESQYKDLSELLHFSEDESFILNKAIESIEATTDLKELLKKKLYSIYNFDRVATPISQKHNLRIIQKITNAISAKKQIAIINYHSANSKNICNRLVEPFDFTQNYTSLWAYEPESGICKTFKISRITNIEISDQDFMFEDNHKKGDLDVFRMNGTAKIHVSLKMTIKAFYLLIEEFPRAEIYTKKINNNSYLFETDVSSVFGIGRFVLGLPQDIEIINTPELRDYVISEMKTGIVNFEKNI